jgi:hypothetical protein
VKSHPPKPSAVTRRQDAALAELRVLADSAFPLSERLRRERALEPDELYAIAFHLAEGRAEQQSVARDLLDHLASKHPRAKVGKAARNKRRLLGS